MRKLSFKVIRLLAPLLLWVPVVVAIDPFDYFNISHLIDSGEKLRATCRSSWTNRIDSSIYKTVQFRRSPAPNVILGDSRAFALDAAYVKKVSGEDYFNFGIPGGTFLTIYKTFWFAAKHAALRKVVICISFNTFNENVRLDAMDDARNATSSALTYVTNPRVVLTTFYLADRILLKPLRHRHDAMAAPAPVTSPPPSDERWQKVLRGAIYYNSYRAPADGFSGLQEIHDYCKAHNIELSFIVFPDHDDVNAGIRKNGLTEAYAAFLDHLARYGRLYNFNNRREITSDRANYADPLHPVKRINDLIVQEAFR